MVIHYSLLCSSDSYLHHTFRDALAAIPGVRTVVMRGYEGEDRAIFDVQLIGPRPDQRSA